MDPVRPRWFYTYVLRSEKDGELYTGSTHNLKQHVAAHNNGLVTSTRHRRPLKLIYFEACQSEEAARRRERYLKTGMGKRYLRNRLMDPVRDSAPSPMSPRFPISSS